MSIDVARFIIWRLTAGKWVKWADLRKAARRIGEPQPTKELQVLGQAGLIELDGHGRLRLLTEPGRKIDDACGELAVAERGTLAPDVYGREVRTGITLSQTEQAVYEHIKANGPTAGQQLARVVGVCRDTVRASVELDPLKLGMYITRFGICLGPATGQDESLLEGIREYLRRSATWRPKVDIQRAFRLTPDETSKAMSLLVCRGDIFTTLRESTKVVYTARTKPERWETIIYRASAEGTLSTKLADGDICRSDIAELVERLKHTPHWPTIGRLWADSASGRFFDKAKFGRELKSALNFICYAEELKKTQASKKNA